MEQQYAKAVSRYVRVSPSKVRRYMDLIKGKSYPEAVATLKFMPSSNAEAVRKVLESAGANAEENHNMVKDSLFVYEAVADQAPTMKRIKARARGRANRIRKRTSHLTVVLSEKPRKKG